MHMKRIITHVADGDDTWQHTNGMATKLGSTALGANRNKVGTLDARVLINLAVARPATATRDTLQVAHSAASGGAKQNVHIVRGDPLEGVSQESAKHVAAPLRGV